MYRPGGVIWNERKEYEVSLTSNSATTTYDPKELAEVGERHSA